MRVLFRADASVGLGTGHVVRCATLAEALREQGAEIIFACRDLQGNLLDWLTQKGFKTIALEGEHPDANSQLTDAMAQWTGTTPPDWLVVDHYGLDANWERAMRPHFRHILVIDDLFNRPHDCDGLLDQNLLDAQSSQYDQLIPEHCQRLFGPRFALLRPEFVQARNNIMLSQRRQQKKMETPRLLVFFGGSDPSGECFKAMEAIRLLPAELPLQVDVVAGGSNPQFSALQARCQALPNITLHRQVNAMADLMAQADLAVGAGGTTTWERFCVGLPSSIIAVADNQVEISRNLAEKNYQIYLGESKTVTAETLRQAIASLMRDDARRLALAEHSMGLVDGLGVQRVVEQMFSTCKTTTYTG